MRWHLSHRADPEARVIADRHYNRQKIGATQFVPPGRCLVLKTRTALWITSYPFAQYVKHRWAGAWVCSAFRREGDDDPRASDMILEAVAATRWQWPVPPEIPSWFICERRHDRTFVERDDLAMVTFVDESKTLKKHRPGKCFRGAGFLEVGRTKGGLIALGLLAENVPAGEPPLGVDLLEKSHA